MVQAEALQHLQEPVITIEASALIEELTRLRQPLPPCVIDINDGLRLLSGRSRKDGGEKQWRPWKRLAAATEHKAVINAYRKAFESQLQLCDEEQVTLTLQIVADALVVAWDALVDELHRAGELDRFMRLEVPVAQIFYKRQALGIGVDTRRLEAAHREAKAEKYKSYIEIASQTNVSPTGMTFRNVDKYLDLTDAAYLGFARDFASIEDYFRLASGFSKFASAFFSYVRSDRDVNIISRLYGSDSRAYPRFQPQGTVTSRILVSDPYLQQLRRKHRGILTADKGFGLAYLDYRQFEPGVLAGLSGDPALTAAYNSKDLYTTLAEALFPDQIVPDARNLCKRMFLGFCYGMSKDHIATVVAGPGADAEAVGEMLSRVNTFFGRFTALEAFKRDTEEQLSQSGFVQTLFGNRRSRTHSGKLQPEERRWAVSQVVQGNASLIFKEALLRLQERFGPNAIVLPMHDAVLMQFETGEVRKSTSDASALMKAAFEHRFPAINAKVSTERFAPDLRN
jgi:DNA polymerase I-like protein with 3'-5' exonuclease and polymerase domains